MNDTKISIRIIHIYFIKETLEKIEGKIELESTYGKGATFTVTIPSLQETATTN